MYARWQVEGREFGEVDLARAFALRMSRELGRSVALLHRNSPRGEWREIERVLG